MTDSFPLISQHRSSRRSNQLGATLESKIEWRGVGAGVREGCLCFIIHVPSTLRYCAVGSSPPRLLLLCCNTTSDEKLIQIKDERGFVPPPCAPPPKPQSEGRDSEEEQRGLGFMFPPVMFCHSSTSKKSLFVSFLFPFSELRMDGG